MFDWHSCVFKIAPTPWMDYKCPIYNTVIQYLHQNLLANIELIKQQILFFTWLIFGTGFTWLITGSASLHLSAIGKQYLEHLCVVCPSLRNAKHTAFFSSLCCLTIPWGMKFYQKKIGWEKTGKDSRTGGSSVVISWKKKNSNYPIICHASRVHKEEEHAMHFMQRKYHAGMRSHQGGLTFYCEDAGTRCRASAVYSFAHVLSLVFWEGLWQVEAVCLSSLYILIVLTVLEHLPLKPPGHLRLGLPGDLHGEAHRLWVHHRLVFQGLFKPRGPRPGVVFLIFVGCRAVDDAALVVHVVVFLLETDDKKEITRIGRIKATRCHVYEWGRFTFWSAASISCCSNCIRCSFCSSILLFSSSSLALAICSNRAFMSTFCLNGDSSAFTWVAALSSSS